MPFESIVNNPGPAKQPNCTFSSVLGLFGPKSIRYYDRIQCGIFTFAQRLTRWPAHPNRNTNLNQHSTDWC